MSICRINDPDAYADAFKALANVNRLAVFLCLLSCRPRDASPRFDEDMKKCVGDLAKGLGLRQSTISRHVRELHRAGLIHLEKSGRFTECRVDGEAATALEDLLSGRLRVAHVRKAPGPSSTSAR
jgi:ArsR family transcriptional regulator